MRHEYFGDQIPARRRLRTGTGGTGTGDYYMKYSGVVDMGFPDICADYLKVRRIIYQRSAIAEETGIIPSC